MPIIANPYKNMSLVQPEALRRNKRTGNLDDTVMPHFRSLAELSLVKNIYMQRLSSLKDSLGFNSAQSGNTAPVSKSEIETLWLKTGAADSVRIDEFVQLDNERTCVEKESYKVAYQLRKLLMHRHVELVGFTPNALHQTHRYNGNTIKEIKNGETLNPVQGHVQGVDEKGVSLTTLVKGTRTNWLGAALDRAVPRFTTITTVSMPVRYDVDSGAFLQVASLHEVDKQRM